LPLRSSASSAVKFFASLRLCVEFFGCGYAALCNLPRKIPDFFLTARPENAVNSFTGNTKEQQ